MLFCRKEILCKIYYLCCISILIVLLAIISNFHSSCSVDSGMVLWTQNYVIILPADLFVKQRNYSSNKTFGIEILSNLTSNYAVFIL